MSKSLKSESYRPLSGRVGIAGTDESFQTSHRFGFRASTRWRFGTPQTFAGVRRDELCFVAWEVVFLSISVSFFFFSFITAQPTLGPDGGFMYSGSDGGLAFWSWNSSNLLVRLVCVEAD